MVNSYRILSIEACDIYRHEQENGMGVGYKLPSEGTDAYFWLFKNKLDYSLDTIELAKVYERICGERFSFNDEYGNEYTKAVINIKFNYVYKTQTGEVVKVKNLRSLYYEKGFNVNGIHYVRYKRSAGSSRQGKCLFIDEQIYEAMIKWSECGLSATRDLASWEAYKSLSLSAIKGLINIPIEGILFVPDFKSIFRDEVVSIELRDGELIAETKTSQIINDIWDGESLLDESLFTGDYANKHMLLLRNKFFKSCAFRTKLQKWINDKNITLADLKERGFVTLATDVSQIVMVTTPNSLKYLKFVGGLSEDNIRNWAHNVDSGFGIVKWDKRTRFFGGRMVRSSYQLLNTIGLNREQADILMRPSIDYLTTIRQDIDFMRYHFSDVCAKESDDDEKDVPDGLAERADVIFRLMNINNDFQRTALYTKFRNDTVKNQKDRLLEGHILLSGTNATLFGNGPELLKYIAGDEMTSVLKPGQIWCGRFDIGQKLMCARSPHITMGNLYCVENRRDGEIWDYFDLGENIVCVNAIGENIQQRLNGCDYDSDTMLVTDDKMLIETTEKYKPLFKVPVCNIPSSGAANLTIAELDYNTSENKIGEIVNLSQKLNSIIWDRLNNGNNDIGDIYLDICKLAVLSGLEIDKAKKAYDNVRVGRELDYIRSKYGYLSPKFFKIIDGKNKGSDKKKKEYASYDTAMEHIYKLASGIDFRKGKEKFAEYIPISSMLNVEQTNTREDTETYQKAVEICDTYKEVINNLYKEMRGVDEDERDVIYDRIRDKKVERDGKIAQVVVNENILLLVIAHYEKAEAVDWHIYSPILNNEIFGQILKRSKGKLAIIEESLSGDYHLYGFRYVKQSIE